MIFRSLDRPGRSTVHSLNGMAATSHPLATSTAIRILRQGGNAMDAAIAACAVQCVVEPESTGIGGDCFCLYSPRGKGILAFDGSGRAPMAATVDWYLERDVRTIGRHTPHAVTVPGAVDAWSQLIDDHGTLTLGDVLLPAIEFAENGFPVSQRVAADWARTAPLLARDENAARFYLKDGRPPGYGSVMKLPVLAETLRLIAKKGRDGFYEGAVAQDIVNYLRKLGGLHTLDDFATAHGSYVEPIRTDYRGYEIHECPPAGQGIAALAMLNILSGFDLAALDPVSADRFHLEIEAARLAYRDRNQALGDPAFSTIPVDDWLSADHADRLSTLIDPGQRIPAVPPSTLPRHEDTVYLTVVDRDRNAVSFINSVFSGFGSCLVSPKTSVVLHNRGQGFVIAPGHPSCIAPGKRPMHTIIPGMMAKDGRTLMPFGVMGGHYQAIGHAHLITNLLDWDMDLQYAIDFPRVFPDVFEDGPDVGAESTIPQRTIEGLEALGHRLYAAGSPVGGAQAIWIDWENGTLRGASDPRKDGQAIGY